MLAFITEKTVLGVEISKGTMLHLKKTFPILQLPQGRKKSSYMNIFSDINKILKWYLLGLEKLLFHYILTFSRNLSWFCTILLGHASFIPTHSFPKVQEDHND